MQSLDAVRFFVVETFKTSGSDLLPMSSDELYDVSLKQPVRKIADDAHRIEALYIMHLL